MKTDITELLCLLYNELQEVQNRAAERHYENYMFEPRFEGDTIYKKYAETWGEDRQELIEATYTAYIESLGGE